MGMRCAPSPGRVREARCRRGQRPKRRCAVIGPLTQRKRSSLRVCGASDADVLGLFAYQLALGFVRGSLRDELIKSFFREPVKSIGLLDERPTQAERDVSLLDDLRQRRNGRRAPRYPFILMIETIA